MLEMIENTNLILSFVITLVMILSVSLKFLSNRFGNNSKDIFVRTYYPQNGRIMINHLLMLLLLTVFSSIMSLETILRFEFVTDIENTVVQLLIILFLVIFIASPIYIAYFYIYNQFFKVKGYYTLKFEGKEYAIKAINFREGLIYTIQNNDENQKEKNNNHFYSRKTIPLSHLKTEANDLNFYYDSNQFGLENLRNVQKIKIADAFFYFTLTIMPLLVTVWIFYEFRSFMETVYNYENWWNLAQWTTIEVLYFMVFVITFLMSLMYSLTYLYKILPNFWKAFKQFNKNNKR